MLRGPCVPGVGLGPSLQPAKMPPCHHTVFFFKFYCRPCGWVGHLVTGDAGFHAQRGCQGHIRFLPQCHVLARSLSQTHTHTHTLTPNVTVSPLRLIMFSSACSDFVSFGTTPVMIRAGFQLCTQELLQVGGPIWDAGDGTWGGWHERQAPPPHTHTPALLLGPSS